MGCPPLTTLAGGKGHQVGHWVLGEGGHKGSAGTREESQGLGVGGVGGGCHRVPGMLGRVTRPQGEPGGIQGVRGTWQGDHTGVGVSGGVTRARQGLGGSGGVPAPPYPGEQRPALIPPRRRGRHLRAGPPGAPSRIQSGCTCLPRPLPAPPLRSLGTGPPGLQSRVESGLTCRPRPFPVTPRRHLERGPPGLQT